ncbi:MAG: prepilin peptidase [Myxococcota bacterium]|nr:prepilin peptidase [Myxococcota bacterium]
MIATSTPLTRVALRLDARRDAGRTPYSLAVACAIGGGLVYSGQAWSLPALPWATLFLCLAAQQDVQLLRIPNWLTAPAMLGALGLQTADLGLLGLQQGLLGLGLAFCLLFIPFAVRWLGAGDVKAVMVLGALWGPHILAPLLVWMLGIGSALGLAWIVAAGGARDLARRWIASFVLSAATRRFTYLPAEAGSVARRGLPFAVAIGLAVIAQQLWGTPWSPT